MIIAQSILQKALDASLSTGADFAEIFVESTYSSTLGILNQKPQKAVVGELYGAGVRLFFGTEVIYVTTNDLSENGLIKAALTAARANGNAQATQQLKAEELKNVGFDTFHVYGEKPWEVDRDRKFKYMFSVDQYARAKSSIVTQVEVAINEKFQRVQIANSKGMHAYDERAYTRLTAGVFVEANGKKESMYENVGQSGTIEFLDLVDLKSFTNQIVDSALLLLNAEFAPAGKMPVVMDNAFGGVIFHEACGHGLETTSVAKGASVFCGKLGEKVANECVTAIDDGTIANGWGSLHLDDEGMPTQKTTLIENGILKSYIVDQLGGIKTGYAPTGSGRRESYKYAPTSRMRNTFIAAGKDSFEEMIKDIDYGLYAKKMGGGSVNPGTGEYNFKVTEAYMIRNGQIQEVVKGACLIGTGIDTLGKITKVSSDLKLATGMCGSVSGAIPAAVGQPQILVSELLVGGRA